MIIGIFDEGGAFPELGILIVTKKIMCASELEPTPAPET
jgi:hypothetical protein